MNCRGLGDPTPQYTGNMDAATCPAISGWAADVIRPTQTLNVDIYSDGVLVATVPAPLPRIEAQFFVGNANHGFSLPAPGRMRDGVQHRVQAKFGGTTQFVPNGDQFLTCFNQLPAVTMTAPGNGAVFNAPATVQLAASASDPDGTVAQVDFYDGASLVGTVTAAPYTVTLTNVAAGTHTYTAKATDNWGFPTTSAAVSVTVNGAPGVAITAPADGAVFTSPASVSITATASDADGSVAKVEFFDGSILIGTVTAAPYSVTLANPSLGTHSLTARATDNKGATLTSTAVSIVINAAPTVSLTSPQANTVYGAPGTVSLAATASDSDGTVAKVDFYQGTTLIGTSTSAPYSFAWSNVAAGSYSITAVATDDRGGTKSSAAVPIQVTAQTAVGITSPADGASSPLRDRSTSRRVPWSPRARSPGSSSTRGRA